MASTTAVSSTGSGTSGTGTTGATGSSNGSSTAFQTALASTVKDAKTLTTSTIGSMVDGALKQQATLVVAVTAAAPTATTASTAAGATNGLVGASASAAGGSGATASKGITVPAELKAYGNGHIPDSALEQIGIKHHELWSVAAEAFKKMRSAAGSDGVDIGVTDSYRSYDEQVDLAKRKGLYSQGGLAAVPGTSNHGWGLAVDVDVTPTGLAWLRQHGSEYGFVEAVPREPWHWEYHGNS